MELSPNVKLFLKNNKETLDKYPKEVDWEDFYYNTAMTDLEPWEIGQITTLLLKKAHPEFYLPRIPANFLHSSPIESFEIPKRHDLDGIAARAFYGSALKEIHIPHNVKKIGTNAFGNCQNLEKVTFDNGCTYLYNNIFQFCSNLKDIKLPGTLKEIGHGCFGYCKSLRKLEIPKAVDHLKYKCFQQLENCEIIFDENFDLVIDPDVFDANASDRGIKVSCYYNTPAFDYCQAHNIPFGRLI